MPWQCRKIKKREDKDKDALEGQATLVRKGS